MGHIFFFNFKEKCQTNVISDIISYAYYIGIDLMIIPVKILILIIIYVCIVGLILLRWLIDKDHKRKMYLNGM